MGGGEGDGGGGGGDGDSEPDDSSGDDTDTEGGTRCASVRRDAGASGGGTIVTRSAVSPPPHPLVTAWRTSDDHAFPPHPEPPAATAAHLVVNAAVSLYIGALFPAPD